MSKIGDFVIDQEDRGVAVYNERDRSYDFRNQKECGRGAAGTKGVNPNHTVGSNVLQRRIRHPRNRGLFKTEVRRNPISLQTISRKGGESAAKRVLYRQTIRRSRIGRARILQKGAKP